MRRVMHRRDLLIAVIRDVVALQTIDDVRAYADRLPADVLEGANQFCDDNDLGNYFTVQMVVHEVSPAYELHGFIQESERATARFAQILQLKGVITPGENNHATT